MYDSSMLHRHLAHENFSLAAIDNVISRGKRLDWAGLLGALFDSLLGATVQAIYYCPACEKETERHLIHLCNVENFVVYTQRGFMLNYGFCHIMAFHFCEQTPPRADNGL